MKNEKGFIDPVSLGFILSLAIGSFGIATDKNSDDQEQLAQDSQIKTELTASIAEEPST